MSLSFCVALHCFVLNSDSTRHHSTDNNYRIRFYWTRSNKHTTSLRWVDECRLWIGNNNTISSSSPWLFCIIIASAVFPRYIRAYSADLRQGSVDVNTWPILSKGEYLGTISSSSSFSSSSTSTTSPYTSSPTISPLIIINIIVMALTCCVVFFDGKCWGHGCDGFAAGNSVSSPWQNNLSQSPMLHQHHRIIFPVCLLDVVVTSIYASDTQLTYSFTHRNIYLLGGPWQ